MKVTVDLDLCQGNGVCLRRAPGVFALVDDEYATVVGDPAASADQVRAAARSCPTQAIVVDDE